MCRTQLARVITYTFSGDKEIGVIKTLNLFDKIPKAFSEKYLAAQTLLYYVWGSVLSRTI